MSTIINRFNNDRSKLQRLEKVLQQSFIGFTGKKTALVELADKCWTFLWMTYTEVFNSTYYYSYYYNFRFTRNKQPLAELIIKVNEEKKLIETRKNTN